MLRTWLGRVIRDVPRKGGEVTAALKTKLDIAKRLRAQQRDSKSKLYALHAPVWDGCTAGLSTIFTPSTHRHLGRQARQAQTPYKEGALSPYVA